MQHVYLANARRSITTLLLWVSGLMATTVAFAQPTVVTVSPVPNARAAAPTSPVIVGFTQPLLANSAAALHVFSSQRGGLRTRGATPALVKESTLQFTPAAYPFTAGETVFSTITTAATSASGALVRPRVVQFTTAVGGTGRGNFLPPATNADPAVGLNAYSVQVGDLDGDGDLDFVAANLGTGSVLNNTVSVRLNDGTGSFSGGSELITGTDPSSLALGDLDGDGDLDFVCANYFANTISVRLNDGTAIFRPPSGNGDVPLPGGPIHIVLGDIDGDGDLDFVTANYLQNTVSVRFNDGTGNFTSPPGNVALPVGSYPRGVALGDVDSDGDLDLLVANSGGNTVSLCLNDGRGGYTTQGPGASVGVATGPNTVLLGDVDGDDDLDLLTPNYGANGSPGSTVSIRLNDGGGRFSAPATNAEALVGSRPTGLALGDIDADGDLDFVAGNLSGGTVSVRVNDGEGRFTAPPVNPEPVLGGIVQYVTLGDVDGDADLDLLAGNYNNFVSVRLNYSPPGVPLAVRIAGDSLLCQDGQLQLTAVATPEARSYRWNTGATTPSLVVTRPGTYTVTATFDGGQTRTAQRRVVVAVPAIQITGDSLLCAGTPVTLRASAPDATSFRWNTGASTPSIQVTASGIYSVLVTFRNGCQSTASQPVRSQPERPQFTLGADTTLCEGTVLLLQPPPGASGAGITYQWSTGARTPTLLVDRAGTYSLQLTTACGTRTSSRRISYQSCLAIPTIITPNEDQRNDRFVVRGLTGTWRLELYSRWGQPIFRTAAYQNDWGEGAAPGVYYYLLHQAGNPTTYKGWLEVVR